jgi:hypothetical protein
MLLLYLDVVGLYGELAKERSERGVCYAEE